LVPSETIFHQNWIADALEIPDENISLEIFIKEVGEYTHIKL
jgi:hypothetical protein